MPKLKDPVAMEAPKESAVSRVRFPSSTAHSSLLFPTSRGFRG